MMSDLPFTPPPHVEGDERQREVHPMCAECGQRPVEKQGDRCSACREREGGR